MATVYTVNAVAHKNNYLNNIPDNIDPKNQIILSPDNLNSYMNFKLGTKKSSYSKNLFIEHEKGIYKINTNELVLDNFFDNKVYKCLIKFKGDKITEIEVELMLLKPIEDKKDEEDIVNIMTQKINTQIGNLNKTENGNKGTFVVWNGQKVQVKLFTGNAIAKGLNSTGIIKIPYYKRTITISYL
ncbi:hypothetical protein SLW70_10070 [Flavobacterium sp. NG2]|uniref:hypothetical protein n=1 Tax=Flavobacterium sp. NG2 TaxID=3097547 RepID=UPI002A824ACD|nr:hypothetical protein [Flavobacterium sp. NG2]WPR70291.1 hypothetical protein SLW70_10070 [Flavobacterium sp. NG2]